MLTRSSRLFLFSNEAHLNSGVRPLLELYCDIATKHVAFFSMCAKFNSIRIYQFTFELLQKYWRIDGFGEKGTERWNFILLLSPLMQRAIVVRIELRKETDHHLQILVI